VPDTADSAVQAARLWQAQVSCTLVLALQSAPRPLESAINPPRFSGAIRYGREFRTASANMLLLLVPIWLHKALPVPFLPIGFCILLGSLGLVLRKRWVTGLSLGIFWAFSLHPTSTWLASGLEQRYPAMEVRDCPKADAVVVLSGMLLESVTSATEWNQAVDRFERGVELVASDRAPKILFTRGLSWPDLGREPEGERLAREALKHGIPADKIEVTDTAVLETSAEVRSIRRTMRQHGWHRIILVTSAMHMPRAMWLAQKEGIEAIPFPADFGGGNHNPLQLTSFLPEAKWLDQSERAIREWMGLTYYRAFGI
jgi:uncharacterized SAM-binding protein YcdF (DUF218 family)